MYIPIEQIKEGHIYRNNSEQFKYAYVLRVPFEYALKFGHPKPETVEEFNQIIVRFYNRNEKTPGHFAVFEYHQNYNELNEQRFVEQLDVPLKYDIDLNHYVELQPGYIWQLESMCYAMWHGDNIYSQANPYKFNYKISLASTADQETQRQQILENVIGVDKFVRFYRLSNGIIHGLPSYTADDYYFQTPEDYHLARLALPAYEY